MTILGKYIEIKSTYPVHGGPGTGGGPKGLYFMLFYTL